MIKLYHELKAYPIPARSAPLSSDNVAIPFKMRLDGDVLSFFSTTMIFGTPVDITLSELALETFFPADDLTAERMRTMAAEPANSSLVRARIAAYLWGFPSEDAPMSTLKPLQIDIVSDVVCPWCYIGKRRIENALALAPDVPVEVHWRPFFLNSWVPREGISRDEYLTAKFGSLEAYKGIAGRVVAAAGEEGLTYRPELVKRQPNTIDCHRLIHWADAQGQIRRDEAAADGIVFPRRRRSHRHRRAGAGGGRLRARCRRRAPASCDRRGRGADLGAGARKPPTRASPACRPSCSRRNTRCPARSRPISSPAPSARCRRK